MAAAGEPAVAPWHAHHVALRIELAPERVVVDGTLHVRRLADHDAPLVLDGRGLDLLRVWIDDRELAEHEYMRDARTLTLAMPAGPEHTVRTMVTSVPGGPNDNGFTVRPRLISTNCEPHGFRRIVYSIDQPGNRATYDVTLVADPQQYRTLLCNGDEVERGELPDGRHWARFVDPVTKPSYLFAVVAGDLDIVSATHTGPSGTPITIRVAALPDQIGGADFALGVLDEVMSFDEANGGIEHDLPTLTFVAIPAYPDATEYHGLMFFESAVLVTDTRGFVDDDLLLIIANVAHEYGHHVRGNRVTVRTWGQLALKEGLTVLMGQNDVRRHLFGPVARVLDVLDLRRLQYPEEITIGAPVVRGEVDDPSQLYTRTTYLKGAEVFGMLRTALGRDTWAQVFAEFVQRFDLGAAGVDDFLAVAREVAPSRTDDIDGISRWFTTAGRPAVSVEVAPSRGGDATSVVVRRTDALADDPSLAMPITLGFLGADGAPVDVSVDGAAPATEHTLLLDARERTVRATAQGPLVLSPLRGFSAPVDLATNLTATDLATLALHDTDAVARWWATQELMTRAVDAHRRGDPAAAAGELDLLADALTQVLDRGDTEPMLLAQLLTLPDEHMLGDREPQIDVDGVAAGLAHVRATLGTALHDPLLALLSAGGDRLDGTAPADIAARSLVDPVLGLLLATGSAEARAAATWQLGSANHTRAVRAFGQLAHLPDTDLDAIAADTFARWEHAPKLIDRWLRAQSGSRRPDTIERVRALAAGPLYDRTDRARVMGVWFPFATRNRSVFHDRSGAGYRLFVDEVIVLMPINAGLVVRLVGDLLQYRRFDEHRRALLRTELERMADAPGMPDFAVGIVRSLLNG
jgi:aminopeptidase N